MSHHKFCKRGHEKFPGNVIVDYRGTYICVICRKQTAERPKQRLRDARREAGRREIRP